MAPMGKKKQNNNYSSGGFVWSFRQIFGSFIAGLFVVFLLSGAINQVATGQNIAEYFVSIGKGLGVWFEELFTNNGDIRATEQGIYFKNVDPSSGAVIDIEAPDNPNNE